MSLLEEPHKVVMDVIAGTVDIADIEPLELASRIVTAYEHGGYPLTCMYDGEVEVQMPLNRHTPIETLMRALDRYVELTTSVAARRAVIEELTNSKAISAAEIGLNIAGEEVKRRLCKIEEELVKSVNDTDVVTLGSVNSRGAS